MTGTPDQPETDGAADTSVTPDPSVAAWHAFCRRLAALGDRILRDDYPADPADRAEGVRHLATQTLTWLAWAVGYPDAGHPAFFRQNDLVSRWGGPNVDQVTRRARLAPGGVYRISGHMGTCEDFILTLKNGDMHMARYGVLTEVTAAELGIGRGDVFEIVLADTPQPGRWVPLPAEATMVNVREYYFDWQPLPPAVITIERVDPRGTAPPRLDAAHVSAMLDDAADMIEHSLTYWNEWVRAQQERIGTNALSPPAASTGGSEKIAYGFGFFDLAPDQAWLIETDVPDADYFDVQLYSLAWFESLDFANRTTSLNHTQLRPDADGRLRIVVAHQDPGTANWLDTEGRRRAMLTYRWIKARTKPVPVATVVAFADVARPADAGARRDEIAARQAHVAWRYRT